MSSPFIGEQSGSPFEYGQQNHLDENLEEPGQEKKPVPAKRPGGRPKKHRGKRKNNKWTRPKRIRIGEEPGPELDGSYVPEDGILPLPDGIQLPHIGSLPTPWNSNPQPDPLPPPTTFFHNFGPASQTQLNFQPPPFQTSPSARPAKKRIVPPLNPPEELISSSFTGSVINLMLDLGFRTGLLDFCASMEGGLTVPQLAAAAAGGLHEAYVREWLRAMACSRVFEYDQHAGTFQMRSDYRTFFRSESGRALLHRNRMVTEFAQNMEDYVACFKYGTGLGYDKFPLQYSLRSEVNKAEVDQKLGVILDRDARLIRRLRKGEKLRICDIGCGSGYLARVLAREFPATDVLGLDFLPGAIQAAVHHATASSLRNISFQVCNLEQFSPATYGHFDLIIAWDTVHDLVHPDVVLQNVHTCLVEQGSFLLVDHEFSSNLEDNIPHAAVAYSFSTLLQLPLGLAQDSEAAEGSMLGSQKYLDMLNRSGFLDIKHFPGKKGDHSFFICKKSF